MFLQVAALVLTVDHREAHVAAALAGIAAADATCGLGRGMLSRGQDDSQAADLLADGALGDTTLPTKLRRLLADKDAAHYSPNLILAEADAR